MCKYDGPAVLLTVTGFPDTIIRPGQIVKIGRSKGNDIVLCDPAVSRSHAVIKWEERSKAPIIADCNSMAGTKVDGQPVDYAHLSDFHCIHLGATKLISSYYDQEASVPTEVAYPLLAQSGAILTESDDDNAVTLFTEDPNSTEIGYLNTNEEVQKLLTILEMKARTGTLHITGGHNSIVMFAIGKVIQAQHNHLHGELALREICALPKGHYSFSTKCDVGDAHLKLSVVCFLRSIRMSSTQRGTRRPFFKTFKH